MTSNVGEALQEAIARARQWAEDDKAHKAMEHKQTTPTTPTTNKPFQVTTNTNRLTFEQVKHHPDTRANIIQALVRQGHHKPSVVSVLGQMRRQGMIDVDDEGIMHVCISEYQPVKNARTLRSLAKKGKVKEKREEKREEKRPVSISSVTPMRPKDPPPGKPLPWSVREILEMLDVLQARAVYDELKKIFGEAR